LPESSTHSAVSLLAKCACQAPIAASPGTRLIRDCRYWGTSETLLPVYQTVDKAIGKHSDVDTVVNFASSRSVYSSTMELLEFPQIKCIAIIAEGVPERVSCP
jgi:succinyl-CoA synthetase alpha subunit